MESLYKKAYWQSWHLIKTNWHLLFFGLFVVALGLTGDFKVLTILGKEDALFVGMLNWINVAQAIIFNNLNFNDLPTLFEMLGVFFFFAIILVLGISSQGGLIHATAKKPAKNGAKEHELAENLRVGVENFWPLLALNALNLLVGFIFVAGVIYPIIYAIYLVNNPPLANFFVSLVVFFSFIPLSIIISFVTRYGEAFIVLKNKSAVNAFYEGWRLFQVYWLISVENAVLLSIYTALYTVAIISLLALIATPFIIVGLILMQISAIGVWIIIFAGTLTAIIIFILAASFYGAFFTVLWTNIFLQLTAKTKVYSKTERVLKKHLPLLDR